MFFCLSTGVCFIGDAGRRFEYSVLTFLANYLEIYKHLRFFKIIITYQLLRQRKYGKNKESISKWDGITVY